MPNCFLPAHILLPGPDVPLDPWACIAVDQFTSQPAYWAAAERLAAGKPSTLHIVLPEAYLGTEQEAPRLQSIRAAMEDYLTHVLCRHVHGYVYTERTQLDGSVRQGLVGLVDLEAYSFHPGDKPAIRPSESTVVERIPPRLAIRRGARLETPHVMMLADDAGCTLIEPIGRRKQDLPLLYDGALMLGGGRLTGWAVEDPALLAEIEAAVTSLGDADAFAARWPGAAGQPPMVLAVGDGNHSLATAKAYWEELKPTLPPEQLADHPARYCLAEVCNVHSPAIQIEPIHRVVFGLSPADVCTRLDAWAAAQGARDVPGAQGCRFTVCGGDFVREYCLQNARQPLTVGVVEAFLDDLRAADPACRVDYIHGEASARALAGEHSAAILLPPFAKDDLFRGVVLGGVLPRKTFSMGHAEEKRYYNECRALV